MALAGHRLDGGRPRPRDGDPHASAARAGGRWPRGLLAVHTACVFAFLYLPIGVLAAFLATGGNKAAAARNSHLARPTFYERLHRIEAILGTDLSSAESRTSLHVALLALDASGLRVDTVLGSMLSPVRVP